MLVKASNSQKQTNINNKMMTCWHSLSLSLSLVQENIKQYIYTVYILCINMPMLQLLNNYLLNNNGYELNRLFRDLVKYENKYSCRLI